MLFFNHNKKDIFLGFTRAWEPGRCSEKRRKHRFDPWAGLSPGGKKWQPINSILAWEVPWTEKPGGLQSMGLQESHLTEWLSTHMPSAELYREGSS